MLIRKIPGVRKGVFVLDGFRTDRRPRILIGDFARSQAMVFYEFSSCKVKEAQTWKKITDLEMNKQEIEELI